uniref:Uncharacterized protein n=1 Tax=Anguilla anguilla TaxID=7936 RepID=A0A0E9R0D5_ANGAN
MSQSHYRVLQVSLMMYFRYSSRTQFRNSLEYQKINFPAI